MEHYQHPRNFGKLETPTHRVRRDHPLCGDRIDLQLKLSPNSQIQAIKFHGRGCVLSQASASMMTEAVQGKTLAQAHTLAASFQKLLSADEATEPDAALGELLVFVPIKDFPSRLSCILLAWQALALCLAGECDTESLTS
jgi:nitrogen fixation NifU-like protein